MPDRAGAVLSDDSVSGEVVEPLLAWGNANLRQLPWRETRDPWAVLVSEIMLQQTQVDRVVDRWTLFLERFPTASHCAAATPADVIELWIGLGYNRRALNLWRAAVQIRDEFDGEVPQQVDQLVQLPGIGPYTARAVAAFAFESDVAVVDTNVGRLLARWSGARHTAKSAQLAADRLVPSRQGWLWNQSLLDFASAICTKRNPACESCPLRRWCTWAGDGPDPAIGSAGVSQGQSRFEGSVRQVRGRLLKAAQVDGVQFVDLVSLARQGDDGTEVAEIADALTEEGMLERLDDRYVLATGAEAVSTDLPQTTTPGAC